MNGPCPDGPTTARPSPGLLSERSPNRSVAGRRRRWFVRAFPACVAGFVAGCFAFHEKVVIPPYRPPAGTARVESASRVKVRVDVSPVPADSSIELNSVEFTLPGAAVADAVRRAFEAELSERGFSLAPQGTLLSVRIHALAYDLKGKFIKTTTEGTLGATVELAVRDAPPAFAREVEVEASRRISDGRPQRQIGSAVEVAIAALVAKTFAEPGFLEALLATANP
jgi:hypothetical protein